MPVGRVSIRLDRDVRERVKRLAEKRQRSSHWLLRNAIHQYVDREEARELFFQRGENAWRHHRKTGKNVSGREVAAWLSTWADEDEAAPPACHR
ncbi:MAG: ribbon-helix-helix protein, CopG family [Bryobacterales bacterium]|nr:ribbon-helix-helix protein, CopG family [Bryobacterales bacterium]